jgi:hypothetical protein
LSTLSMTFQSSCPPLKLRNSTLLVDPLAPPTKTQCEMKMLPPLRCRVVSLP